MDGNRSQYLTSLEFHNAMTRLGTQIDNRFNTVDSTLAETRERLAVVERQKLVDIDEVAELAGRKNVSKKQSVAWGSVAAGVAFGAYEFIKAVIK